MELWGGATGLADCGGGPHLEKGGPKDVLHWEITLFSFPGKVYARERRKGGFFCLESEPQTQEEQCGFHPGSYVYRSCSWVIVKWSVRWLGGVATAPIDVLYLIIFGELFHPSPRNESPQVRSAQNERVKL